MARAKRTSSALDAAKARASALATIDKEMDFGNNVSIAALDAANAALEEQLIGYNQLLSSIDDALNKLEEAETKVTDLASRLLSGVKTKYGADSSEYERAGGTRTSEIKRSPRGSKLAARAQAAK